QARLLYCRGKLPDDPWLDDFATDSKFQPDVVLVDEGGSIAASSRDGKDALAAGRAAAISLALCNLGRASSGADITIRAEAGERALRVDPGAASLKAKDRVMSPVQLEAWMKGENEVSLEDLVEQLRSPMGVIPFV